MSSTSDARAEFAETDIRPVLSEQFALTWVQTTVCACASMFFLYLSYVPLFYTDIWCHVSYGKWIVEHLALPQEDPFMPLAEGMRVIDSAWLAQVIFAQLETWGGPNFLSAAFAITVFATYLILARVFYLQGGHSWLALCGAAAALGIGWTRHAIVRPEIFGGLCLALLLWILVRTEPWRSRAANRTGEAADKERPFPRRVWFVIPLLFAAWANLHGSFLVGIAVLGCHALGCAVEVLWRTRRPWSLLTDRGLQAWVLLCELALAATLLNPYGSALLVEAITFGKNENLRDVLEWFPLQIIHFEGLLFSAALIALFVLVRHSRQKMRAVDVLLLLVFAAAVAPAVRMIGWFAQVFVFVAMPLAADLWRRFCPASIQNPPVFASTGPPARRFLLSLISLLFVWIAFALSPFSSAILGGKVRGPDQVYNGDTPRAAARYLREHPPQGLVFCPQWWGDWLVWDGPPRLQVFMTSYLHVAPRQVWKDYLRVARGESGWEATLDRYNVQTLIVHKQLQLTMARTARRSPNWQVVFEDDRTLVLNRKEPQS